MLDIKSKEELKKHKNNYYLDIIKKRFQSKEYIEFVNKYPIFNCKLPKLYNTPFYVDINNLCSFIGSQFISDKDPLTGTALQLIDNCNIDFKDTYLYYYFKEHQPKNYKEVFNIKGKSILSKFSQHSFFYPWIHKKLTKKKREGLFGPKDISVVKHRVYRIKNLIELFNKYDYIPTNNDIITGCILLKENDYKFLVTSGHHRCSVICANYLLGKNKSKKILVKNDNERIKSVIVDIKNIHNWPGVKSNVISKKEAKDLFNSFFV